MTITSSEALRLSFLPEPALVALSAADDARHAIETLGLWPEVEPDEPGAVVGRTACSWCGRTDPPGGLTPDYPRPPLVPGTTEAPEPVDVDNSNDMHCVDEMGCHAERERREPLWLDKSGKWWRIDWDKYRCAVQYQAEQAAKTRFGGGIYALAAEEVDPQFLVALDAVRAMVEPKAAGLAEDIIDMRELVSEAVALAAVQEQGMHDPAATQARPEPVRPGRLCQGSGCSHMTIACPDKRMHLHSHFSSMPGGTDVVGALVCKEAKAREQS